MFHLVIDATLLRAKNFLSLLCCINTIVIWLLTDICIAEERCSTEYSEVLNWHNTAQWTDSNSRNDRIVFSTPRCINENGTEITRICHDGSWIPKRIPICDRISFNEYCPDTFSEANGYCIIEISKNKLQNSQFRYENLLNPDNTRNITICEHSISTSDEIYGSEVKKHCNGSSYMLLASDHRFFNCPKNCIPGELGKKKCYCKVKGQTKNKLVSIKSLQQKNIISQLANGDICQIDNTSLPEISNCHVVITHNFYGFATNSTQCSIIEYDLKKIDPIEDPSMALTFNERKKKLTLIIQNYEALSPSVQYRPQCFTNAGFEIIKTVNISKIKNKNLAIYEVHLEKYIGEYWCEAMSLNLTKIQSNIVLAYQKKKGNEFSLRLRISHLFSHYDKNDESIRIEPFMRKLSAEIKSVVKAEVRFMKIYALDLNKGDVLLHLTTTVEKDVRMEHTYITSKLKQLPNHLHVEYCRSVEYCLPEEVAIENSKKLLHWEISKIWERKVPKELCFQRDNLPVTRTCRGNFLSGARWSNISQKCLDIQVSSVTKFLHEALYANITTTLMANMTTITVNDSLSYLDIYFYGELLLKIEKDFKNHTGIVDDVFKIINNLSKKNRHELSTAQSLFNATDTVLIALDEHSSFTIKEGIYSFHHENLIIISLNPNKTNISGIYLLGSSTGDLSEMKVEFLTRNQTIESIKPEAIEDLDLLTQVPEAVLQSIEEDCDDVSTLRIIFKIFREDSLFISKGQKAISKIVNVDIPGYGSYLNESIPIVMRSFTSDKSDCVFWDFGDKVQRHKGEWSTFGGKYTGNFLNNTGLHVCYFSHLTHFALLIMTDLIEVEETNGEITNYYIVEDNTSYNLTIITIVGGVLSIVGILGIYVTAAMFEQWRNKDGTKILLNLSTAIFFEIIFLQFSGINNLGSINCKMIGCLLHYMVLSKFCWMFIYALLQYRRFVKVLGAAPKHIVLKSMVFGWGFAFIPILFTLIITPESYSKTYICYLHGIPLYIAVIFPVGLVIVSNFIVFIVVMYNVTTKKVESTVDTKFSLLQLYLAILLFSVLGLPWLFALLAEVVQDNFFKKTLMYLFCSTGTIQGFILFIFYVLVNEETRERWRKYFQTKYEN